MDNKFRLLYFFLLAGIVIACEKNVDPSKAGNSNKDPLPDPEIGQTYKIIQDTFQGVPLLIIGSEFSNFLVSFRNDKGLQFKLPKNRLPIVLSDQEGNEWDVFGEALSVTMAHLFAGPI